MPQFPWVLLLCPECTGSRVRKVKKGAQTWWRALLWGCASAPILTWNPWMLKIVWRLQTPRDSCCHLPPAVLTLQDFLDLWKMLLWSCRLSLSWVRGQLAFYSWSPRPCIPLFSPTPVIIFFSQFSSLCQRRAVLCDYQSQGPQGREVLLLKNTDLAKERVWKSTG